MRVVLSFVLILSLAACAGQWPKNPEEFRKFSSHIDSHVTKVEVARPLAEVAATWRRQSRECLAMRVQYKRVYAPGVKTDAGHVNFTPTFAYHGNHAELDLQRKAVDTNEYVVGKAPKDGIYELVADATRVSAHRTKLVVYRLNSGSLDEKISNAVVHWAKGDNLGCPTL